MPETSMNDMTFSPYSRPALYRHTHRRIRGKSLAWALEKKCVGVSTLEAMAWGLAASGITCPVADAQRSQVYNALFRIQREACGWLLP